MVEINLKNTNSELFSIRMNRYNTTTKCKKVELYFTVSKVSSVELESIKLLQRSEEIHDVIKFIGQDFNITTYNSKLTWFGYEKPLTSIRFEVESYSIIQGRDVLRDRNISDILY